MIPAGKSGFQVQAYVLSLFKLEQMIIASHDFLHKPISTLVYIDMLAKGTEPDLITGAEPCNKTNLEEGRERIAFRKT